MTYVRQIYIYEKSTVQLASVGLAQARPNYNVNILDSGSNDAVM